MATPNEVEVAPGLRTVALATWSDVPLGHQLADEARRKGVCLPQCLTAWVDLVSYPPKCLELVLNLDFEFKFDLNQVQVKIYV